MYECIINPHGNGTPISRAHQLPIYYKDPLINCVPIRGEGWHPRSRAREQTNAQCLYCSGINSYIDIYWPDETIPSQIYPGKRIFRGTIQLQLRFNIRGSSPFLIHFQKILTFCTSEMLPSKNNIEQTERGLARRQNNGDTKPSFQKPVYHHRFSQNEFSLHRGFLGKNTWWSWREDPSGRDYRVIFLFSPTRVRYANK